MMYIVKYLCDVCLLFMNSFLLSEKGQEKHEDQLMLIKTKPKFNASKSMNTNQFCNLKGSTEG